MIERFVGLLWQVARVGLVSSALEPLPLLVGDGSGLTQALAGRLSGPVAASHAVSLVMHSISSSGWPGLLRFARQYRCCIMRTYLNRPLMLILCSFDTAPSVT